MTAEEYLSKNHPFGCADYELKEALINFAKIHVELALKKASEEVELDGFAQQFLDNDRIDKDTILDAYPLENIK